jgi:hypothetical protein
MLIPLVLVVIKEILNLIACTLSFIPTELKGTLVEPILGSNVAAIVDTYPG